MPGTAAMSPRASVSRSPVPPRGVIGPGTAAAAATAAAASASPFGYGHGYGYATQVAQVANASQLQTAVTAQVLGTFASILLAALVFAIYRLWEAYVWTVSSALLLASWCPLSGLCCLPLAAF